MGELANKVRAKYPGAYNDISDAELEAKVVARYPGVYDDLVEPSRQWTGSAEDEQIREQMRRAFVDQEAAGLSRIKEKAKIIAQDASPYVRPVLETGGLIGGGIIGGVADAPTGAIPGAVVGAGLGYGIGKNLADTYDEALGLRNGGDMSNRLLQSVADVETGATLEMGGQVAGNLVGRGISQIKKGIPLGDKRAQVEAGNKLTKTTPTTSFTSDTVLPATEQEVKNAVEADKLAAKLNTAFTQAQRTGNLKQALIEQGLTAKDADLAYQLATREGTAQQTALGKIQGALGKGADIPITRDTQEIGSIAREVLSSRATAAKEASKPLWDAVPDYPMPFDTTTTTARELISDPLSADIAAPVIEKISGIPRTVKGMQAVERFINNEITAASRAGKNNDVRVLSKLKDAVNNDFKIISKAAETGDLGLHNGQLVNVAALKNELEGINGQLSKATVSTPETENLIVRRLEIRDVLNNIQPADDVAAAYTAAKQFSKEQYFDKFRRGAIDKVLAKGNESSGYRLTDEAIARKIFNPSGADDIVKAVGQSTASGIMKDHAINELAKNKTTPAMMNWIKRNATTLDKLGLTQEMKQIVKNQLPQEFEKMLLSKRINKSSDAPYFTLMEANKLLQSHGRIIKELYGTNALETLRDYHKLMKVLSRNKNNITYSGGSNTAEKLINGLTDAAFTVSSIPAASLWRHATKFIQSGQEEAVNQLLKEAMLNPEKARQLIQISRTANDTQGAQMFSRMLKPYLLATTISTKDALTNNNNYSQRGQE